MRRHNTFTKWGEPAVPFLPIRRYSLSIGVCAPPTTSAGGAQTPLFNACCCIVQAGASAFSLCSELGGACTRVAVPLDAGWRQRFPGSVQLMGGAARASPGWNACQKPPGRVQSL